MATGITETELLEALASAAPGTGPSEARTVRELCREQGISEKRLREALHVLKADGRLIPHRVTREALDGRQSVVTAYTITPKS